MKCSGLSVVYFSFLFSFHYHHSTDQPFSLPLNLLSVIILSLLLSYRISNNTIQTSVEHERTSKIELWSSVAQHCLLVGNYNSATSILEPICRLQSMVSEIELNFFSPQNSLHRFVIVQRQIILAFLKCSFLYTLQIELLQHSILLFLFRLKYFLPIDNFF